MQHPGSFAFWQSQMARDPAAAAHGMVAFWADRSPQLQRAVIAGMPDREALAAEFSAALHRSDNPLRGIPYLVKDVFDVKHFPTGCGSRFFAETVSDAKTSWSPLAKLEALGAVFAGKTQCHEFAFGLTGENPHFGDVPHPRFADRLAGGSSSGSAWAVAAGLVPLAFGTDTAGSIRVPASYCGVYGLRLMPGLWTETGLFPLAPSFDTVGWFTANAGDMTQTVQALLADQVEAPRESAADRSGVFFCPSEACVDAQVLKACRKRAQQLGARCETKLGLELAHDLTDCRRAFSILQTLEVFQVHRTMLDAHRPAYDPQVWARIDSGRSWSAAQIDWARGVVDRVRTAVADVLTQANYLALPAVPNVAPTKEEVNDESHRRAVLELTTPGSVAGLPVLTLPIPVAHQLTAGLQIIFPDLKAISTFLELHRES